MTTQELKTKLLEEYEEGLLKDFCSTSTYGVFPYNMVKIKDFLSSALSQMEEATQEIKKGKIRI